jgi:hypothetical protein
MSHLLDEVGQRESARHNFSGRRDNLGAINSLCGTLEGGACPETASPTGKEAPQRPHERF